MPKIDSAIKVIYSPNAKLSRIYNLCIYIDSINSSIINFKTIRVRMNNALYEQTLPFNITLDNEHKIRITDLYFQLKEHTKIFTSSELSSSVLFTIQETGEIKNLEKISIIDNLNDIYSKTWVKLLMSFSSIENDNNKTKKKWNQEVWVESKNILLDNCYN